MPSPLLPQPKSIEIKPDMTTSYATEHLVLPSSLAGNQMMVL